jgi:hypothetical protein
MLSFEYMQFAMAHLFDSEIANIAPLGVFDNIYAAESALMIFFDALVMDTVHTNGWDVFVNVFLPSFYIRYFAHLLSPFNVHRLNAQNG